MVSRAFSRKSSRQGLMTISSGSVCRATQAYSLAVFTPPLPLPLAVNRHAGASKRSRLHTSKSSIRQLLSLSLFSFLFLHSFQVSLVSSPLQRSSICMSQRNQRSPFGFGLFSRNKKRDWGGGGMHGLNRGGFFTCGSGIMWRERRAAERLKGMQCSAVQCGNEATLSTWRSRWGQGR